MMRRAWADVTVGDVLPEREFPITRADLIAYAGASGDLNPIHWNERIAREVGLPDVIGHGMLSMARALVVATDWAGDPGAVVRYGVKMSRPVVVPDDGSGAVLTVSGVVAEKGDDATVRVDLTATSEGVGVLARAQVVLRLERDRPDAAR